MAALIAGAKYRGEFEDTLRLLSKKLQILMGTPFFSLMRFRQLFEQRDTYSRFDLQIWQSVIIQPRRNAPRFITK